MLYQHMGVQEKIQKLENPYFANLKRSDKIVGTCCFCKRTTVNRSLSLPSLYVRYFSFKDLFRAKSTKEKARSKRTGLREEIHSLLSGGELGMTETEKFFFYAYVDPRNERSAVLCNEFGFEKVRQCTTVLFNRINPAIHGKIVEVPFDESVKSLLQDFYRNFNMLTFENFSGRKYYFIQDENGKNVAGVQASFGHWRVHSLPGSLGKLALNLFSHIPFVNKLLSKDFRFLVLEGFYCTPGNEEYLEPLVESLLVKFHVNSALSFVDPASSLYDTLTSLNLGVLSKLNKEVRGDVICRFINFSQEEKENFKNHPAYISGFDAT